MKMSLPAWERGLKYCIRQYLVRGKDVAPRVGAWIEIFFEMVNHMIRIVAPRVGAWIEIYYINQYDNH